MRVQAAAQRATSGGMFSHINLRVSALTWLVALLLASSARCQDSWTPQQVASDLLSCYQQPAGHERTLVTIESYLEGQPPR